MLIYTICVGFTSGWNVPKAIIEELNKSAQFAWASQFILDFASFLVLIAIWIVWRHEFSLSGFVWGFLVFIGGILVLAPYLFVISLHAGGNVKDILIGKNR